MVCANVVTDILLSVLPYLLRKKTLNRLHVPLNNTSLSLVLFTYRHFALQPDGFIARMVASYMTSSEDLDAEAAKRGHASHKNRLALVEDLARPCKTAVRSFVRGSLD